MQERLTLDVVLSFCRDKIPGHGEDSYCYSFCDTAGLLGVFDGCGGAGARKHDFYSGNTEAYMASRFCAGAFYDEFRKMFPCACTASQLAADAFAPEIARRLQMYAPPKDESGFQIKGAAVRSLPSTAAAALVQQSAAGEMLVSAIWAGDSRVYIMDANGLAQLTVDDTSVTDPMENIYEDGVLRNLICGGKTVDLHCSTVCMQEPFVVFAATDGCFGYFSTPMEFEGMLLSTLLEARSAAEWENALADAISAVAGDDHTLCMAVYGYGSFADLRRSFARRYAFIRKNYLLPLKDLPVGDRQTRFRLWEHYKADHMRYIKDGLA